MIERVTTSGSDLSLDGEDFEVENNVWIAGDEREAVIIDAAHDHRPIAEAVGDRAIVAVIATHGHNDHINAAGPLADALGAPIWLHPDDLMLWRDVYPERSPDRLLSDGMRVPVAGLDLEVIHTPGHSPGGCCVYDAANGILFSGDTLFKGGPGATGRSYSDFATIIASIRDRLLVLPGATRVLTGHGEETTIGAEAPCLPEWLRDHYKGSGRVGPHHRGHVPDPNQSRYEWSPVYR